jgi:Swt1-like HEPN
VATNPQLRADLLKKLGGVSRQRLSQRVADIKKAHGPMSTEDATYVLAHQQGLDLPKYLAQATVDRVRGMLQRTADQAAPAPAVRATPTRATTSRPVRIDADAAIDPLLPAVVADDAKNMAKVYTRLYVLENSARNVIHRVMTAKHGADWWSKKAPAKVQKNVQDRKNKEDKRPWTGKRGSHEIHYSDFGDLQNIILANWADFEDVFQEVAFITRTLGGLEPMRNITAHNNRVAQKEEDRLRIHVDDWVKQVNGRRAFIPERTEGLQDARHEHMAGSSRHC